MRIKKIQKFQHFYMGFFIDLIFIFFTEDIDSFLVSPDLSGEIWIAHASGKVSNISSQDSVSVVDLA